MEREGLIVGVGRGLARVRRDVSAEVGNDRKRGVQQRMRRGQERET